MPGVPKADGPRGHDPHPCLSVVIPCYNEVATVREVVDQVLDSPWTAEVIVVDDGSTDGTREVLTGIDDPRVRVLLQPHNQGKGAALRRGFGAAAADYVVVQDADLEYDPAEYGTLMEPLVDGLADVVFGSRFISSRPHRVLYFWHSVGNRFLTTLSNMFTNLNLTDMETCYKVFRREVIQSVVIEEDRFGFEPEVTAKVAQAGWRVYEVGISYNGRTYAEGKKIGWRDGVRAVWCIAKYSQPGERVRTALPPGLTSPAPTAGPATMDFATVDSPAGDSPPEANGDRGAAVHANGADSAAGEADRAAGAPHRAG
jgi:glycosyltransferase involved in cell wall biosynthesis